MTVLLLLALAAAQDTVIVDRPGRAGSTPAERRAVSVYNAPGTTRVLGAHTIGRDAVVAGDVAVLDGPLRVEGRVTGDLIAINADVEIVAGGEIGGDVLVLGGRATVSDDARLDGTLEQHTARVRVRFVDERLEIEDRDEPVRIRDRRREDLLPRRSRWYPVGRASLVLSTEDTYNRVEGLPILAGPRFTWRTENLDARIEAFGIFRTAASLDLESREVGYRVASRVRFGGRQRPLELGLRAFDQVLAIEDWQLRDSEVGWAAVLFHKDYRDYFLARGVGASAKFRVGDALLAYADVSRFDASSIDARDPWTLTRNSRLWRPNPTIDEGRFTEYVAGLELSSQRGRHSHGGAWLKAEWLHGVGANVSERVLPLTIRAPLPASGYRYDRLYADLRVHQAMAGGGVSLRAVAAGDLGDAGPLPIHRRLSLGGPDPMPGFDFRRFNCNAGLGDPAQPALCDRMVLFQAEYRTGLSFDVDLDRDEDDERWWGGWDWFDWDDTHLLLFADAGAAWLGDATPRRLNWDFGGGIEFGGFGIYVARALEENRPVRVIMRLHRRF
jgi:hypothetical protein